MKNLALILAISFALTACGGSGSSKKVDSGETGNAGGGSGGTTTPIKKTQDEAMTAVLTSLADNYILPAYSDLVNKADDFEMASIDFCSNLTATETELKKLQSSWSTLSLSWQHSKPIKLGPVTESFFNYRLQIWPDTNAAISRGVATLLAAEPLNEEVVALTQDGAQGIPALEYLLYPELAVNGLLVADDKAKRCEAVMSIAANVKTITSTINDKWLQTSRDEYINGTGDFSCSDCAGTPEQAILEKQLTNWFELMEVIVDNKINKALDTALPGKVDYAEQYRSETSFDNIKENIKALELVYLGANDYGFDDYLVEINENETLDTTIKSAFFDVYTAIDGLSVSLEQAITTQETRAQLIEIATKITALRTIMASDFVQVTGFNPGFNSNDGD